MSSPGGAGDCAHCKKPATTRCTGCLGAPIYDQITITSTFYCSKDCQVADRQRHKSECRKLQARKSLARAAQLLQAIFYQIRSHAYPKQMDTAIFNSMYVEGSTIFLDSVLTSETLQQPPTLRPFPISFDSNEDHSKVEAVLAYSGCVEALMYLHNFAKALLADLCSKIEEITVSPANLKFRIIHVTADGSLFDRPNDHNLYKVTLKNGDVWAVDPSGAQFGYTNPLSAWHNYQRHRLSKVNTVVEFGHISRYLFNTTANLYESPGECESTDWVAQRVEKRTLAKMIDEIISAQDLSNMLTGSDGVFESAKGRFLERLEGHVKSAMERLYSREVLQRLRQEVDGEMDLVRQFANTRIFRY